ncbi:UDP-glucosyltransferase 2-like [Periplaneta americana]|uniref:UDP-glucosyltransferase 2-like n=1 Tax=Periplaneta americana TaxID=6978 RepID=UPI0037E82104
MKVLAVAFCVLAVRLAEAAKILGVFSIPSISHQLVYRSLMKELHSRGHHITVLTPDPIRDSSLQNYTEIEIDLSAAYTMWKNRLSSLTENRDKGLNYIYTTANLIQLGLDVCEVELNLPEVKNFLYQDNKFDLVMIEWILSPCFAVIGYKVGAPVIGISSIPPTIVIHDTVGNPAHPAYSPDILLSYTDRPNFIQRIHATVHYVALQFVYRFWILPSHDALVRKHFKDNSMPYIEDVVKNVSLVLVSSHFSFHYPRPIVPAMVDIGGLHLHKPKPLPKNLKNFLDGAPEGVIYFSLGTNVRSDGMSVEKRQIFLDAFSELQNFRILWKWEGDELPGKLCNVKVAKWLPQQDILSHPKIKVFIYQGGMQSTEEAIQAQVPLIGIPFFADQDVNVRKVVEAGAGIYVDFQDITKDVILNTIHKIIHDPSYKASMKKLSEIASDQPENPLDRAVWWTEYVIRHKGARHLRSAALDLTWYQYLLLDVIAFFAVIPMFATWLISCITRFIVYVIKSRMSPRPKRD